MAAHENSDWHLCVVVCWKPGVLREAAPISDWEICTLSDWLVAIVVMMEVQVEEARSRIPMASRLSTCPASTKCTNPTSRFDTFSFPH
ncbi:hypothetical protein BDZ89DRAFT_243107 [Hymenopellis radicata]|nr:hypothetical protein BDZ89DRAFT_243107 [Hymenopellis radicata]